MENLQHLINQNLILPTRDLETTIDLEDEIIPEASNFPPAAEALDYEEEFDSHPEPLQEQNNWSD